ncbi:MAG: aldose 1-epimerase family protein [Acidobacteriia bacterium]|nr:aldose 1-epimerase family protein [Terriglobia bacterium]
MPETTYRGRRAAVCENHQLRVTVLQEGGHIAEIFDKATNVNPLWTPPWRSIEPSIYDPIQYPEYGAGVEAKLLAGIMGHNLCLDLFGGPSPEEAAAGMTVHGEASVGPYEISETDGQLVLRTELPWAQLGLERRLELRDRAVRIRETVENLSACDRPIAWTQHVTLGPPFLERGVTQFRASATRSKVFESDFGSAAYLKAGAEFDWPAAPHVSQAPVDLRVFNQSPVSSAFTTHLMDPQREHAFFVAFSPTGRLAFGYVWKQADFPWMGIWEENHSRANPPWNGATLARGMEFGVSPIPESRREMIDRGRLFGVPTYRWVPGKSRLEAEYWAVARNAEGVPETLEWPG